MGVRGHGSQLEASGSEAPARGLPRIVWQRTTRMRRVSTMHNVAVASLDTGQDSIVHI